MNRIALPILAGLLAASSPAQQVAHCIVLVRCGVTDIVLNAPLVDGILADPGCFERLKKVHGDTLSHAQFRAQMPVAHLPGTFQVHVEASLYASGEWTADREAASIAAIAAHLQASLDRLLFADPQAHLRAREADLAEQLAKATAEQTNLAAGAVTAQRADATVARQSEALDQQLVAARVELATEQSAADHLEQLRDKNTRQRDQLTAKAEQLLREKVDLEVRLAALAEQAKDLADPSTEQRARLDALRAEANKVEAEIRPRREAFDRTQEQLADSKHMLSVVLEQMPASALSMNRARARLLSLTEERKALDEQRAGVAALMREAKLAQLAADRLGSEIAAAQTQLGLVRSKLSQLEPVRCEVLRSAR